MKVIVVTTKTEHHNFFLNNLNVKDKDLFVIYEKNKVNHKYKTSHSILKKKKIFEKEIFNNKTYKRKFNKISIKFINTNLFIKHVNSIKPKIIIFFGTSILKKKFLTKIKSKILLNLHGGDPEYYRGLDTLLWTIFHKDYSRLYTTLHQVKAKVDSGDIYKKIRIKINKKTSIINMGIINTLNCIKLSNNFIIKLINKKKIMYKKQKTIGRYYSAMPSDLINVCNRNLKSYVKKFI